MKESDEERRFRQSLTGEPAPREVPVRQIVLIFSIVALLVVVLNYDAIMFIWHEHWPARALSQSNATKPVLGSPARMSVKSMADARREMLAANAHAETDEARARCKTDQGEYVFGTCYAPELLHDDDALYQFMTDDAYRRWHKPLALSPAKNQAECEALGRYWFAPPVPPNYPPMCVDAGGAQKYHLDALPKQ